jgi:hypothetical protein
MKRVATLLGGTVKPPGAAASTFRDDEEEDDEMETEEWDWKGMGRLAAKRTKRVPTLDFL